MHEAVLWENGTSPCTIASAFMEAGLVNCVETVSLCCESNGVMDLCYALRDFHADKPYLRAGSCIGGLIEMIGFEIGVRESRQKLLMFHDGS